MRFTPKGAGSGSVDKAGLDPFLRCVVALTSPDRGACQQANPVDLLRARALSRALLTGTSLHKPRGPAVKAGYKDAVLATSHYPKDGRTNVQIAIINWVTSDFRDSCWVQAMLEAHRSTCSVFRTCVRLFQEDVMGRGVRQNLAHGHELIGCRSVDVRSN